MATDEHLRREMSGEESEDDEATEHDDEAHDESDPVPTLSGSWNSVMSTEALLLVGLPKLRRLLPSAS